MTPLLEQRYSQHYLSAGLPQLVSHLVDKVCIGDVTGCVVQVGAWHKAAEPGLPLLDLLAAESHFECSAIFTTCKHIEHNQLLLLVTSQLINICSMTCDGIMTGLFALNTELAWSAGQPMPVLELKELTCPHKGFAVLLNVSKVLLGLLSGGGSQSFVILDVPA